MKVLKLMGMAAVAALLFTSCLGEGNNSLRTPALVWGLCLKGDLISPC